MSTMLRGMDTMLPHSLEAERGVLGCILIDPDCLSLIADTLKAEHFYQDAHHTIYHTMLTLFERQRLPDSYTVQQELEQNGHVDAVGGFDYIMQLVSHVTHTRMVETYAKDIITYAVRRQTRAIGSQIVTLAHEPLESEDLITQVEELTYSLSSGVTTDDIVSIGDVFNDVFGNGELENTVAEGSITGVPTGFTAIDRLTCGLQKSDLIVMAGRPGMGKTTLMMNIARNAAATYGQGVLAFSLEMSREQLTQRLTASEAHVDLQRLRFRQLSEEEKTRVIEASTPISQMPIWIDHTPAITLVQMRSRIRRWISKHQIDLIVLDYLGLMQATVDGKRIRDRLQEVSEIARGLKAMAREFNIPILALCQLSRAVESRSSKVPQLSDLRESGEIEQAADIVIFIHRDDYYAGFDEESGVSKSNRPGTADVVFAKHRNGPVGEVVVGFQGNETRFYDLYEEMNQLSNVYREEPAYEQE